MASRTCARRPYFSPIGFSPQMKGAERLRDSVARTSLRSPSAAFIGAAQAMARAKTISPPCKADVPYRNPLIPVSCGIARAESLFSQCIELIDRLAGGLGKIAEIKIGCDLVAHI